MSDRLLVCGDRNWTDPDLIWGDLNVLKDEFSEVVHGAAKGADTIAGNIAASLGYKVTPFPAEWSRYGKSAGPIRNQTMLEYVDGPKASRAVTHLPWATKNILFVLAYHERYDESKGTKDMVSRVGKRGGVVRIRSKLSDRLTAVYNKRSKDKRSQARPARVLSLGRGSRAKVKDWELRMSSSDFGDAAVSIRKKGERTVHMFGMNSFQDAWLPMTVGTKCRDLNWIVPLFEEAKWEMLP